ncbi:hypothetical protein [Streptomyces rectiverticillatus]|uniref:hypothetical protein n=1 Tax=Streptomyces rectiverticillatus TaxID=173860 RepID=UPI0015C2DBC3|nr:hypothetical protein [Streptomyces rectiverticillatus]
MTEPLPPAALATLEALLAGPDPVISALRAQIPYTRVASGCDCGCATLDLTVDRTAVAPVPAATTPAAEAWYEVPENAGVMVFARDGYLSLLEIYTSADPIGTWPEPRFRKR